jgi:hypothetical protein
MIKLEFQPLTFYQVKLFDLRRFKEHCRRERIKIECQLEEEDVYIISLPDDVLDFDYATYGYLWINYIGSQEDLDGFCKTCIRVCGVKKTLKV